MLYFSETRITINSRVATSVRKKNLPVHGIPKVFLYSYTTESESERCVLEIKQSIKRHKNVFSSKV